MELSQFPLAWAREGVGTEQRAWPQCPLPPLNVCCRFSCRHTAICVCVCVLCKLLRWVLPGCWTLCGEVHTHERHCCWHNEIFSFFSALHLYLAREQWEAAAHDLLPSSDFKISLVYRCIIYMNALQGVCVCVLASLSSLLR